MKSTVVGFACGVALAFAVFDGSGAPQPAAIPVPQSPQDAATSAVVTPAPAGSDPAIVPTAPGSDPPVRHESVPPVAPLDQREALADQIVAEASRATSAVAVTPPTDAEMRQLLTEVLGAGSPDVTPLEVLGDDVSRLREELSALVGQGHDTKSALEAILGYQDELESIGVSRDVADEIRVLYPQVQSLRGELLLLDLRTKKSESEFKPIGGEDSETPTVEGAAQSAPAAAEAVAVVLPRPHTPFPRLEAMLLFRAGRADEALAMLEQLPVDQLDAAARFALGSCLVAKRRFDDARAILAPLSEDRAESTLAEAAHRQLVRMEMLEIGLVGLDPLLKAVEDNKR